MAHPSPESLEDIPELDITKAKVLGRGLGKHRKLSLRALRVALGKTQSDIAEATGLAQSDVSRLEARTDRKVSTLGRYAEALGGALEIAIVVDGRRYLIEV